MREVAGSIPAVVKSLCFLDLLQWELQSEKPLLEMVQKSKKDVIFGSGYHLGDKSQQKFEQPGGGNTMEDRGRDGKYAKQCDSCTCSQSQN